MAPAAQFLRRAEHTSFREKKVGFFNDLSQANTRAHKNAFPKLQSIKWRAEQILKNRTSLELDGLAERLLEAIENVKYEQVNDEREKYIDRLYEHGGWELQYLKTPCSKEEIRDMIANWPSWMDDRPGCLNEEDIRDLDALQDGLAGEVELIQGVRPPELYALLALVTLNYAAGWLCPSPPKTQNGFPTDGRSHPWSFNDILNAGHLIAEATETICCAERELSNAELMALKNEERHKLAEEVKAQARKEQARSGARAKNAKFKAAQDFVLSEWEQYRDEYDGNKSEFARIYAKRLLNEFNVSIGDRQIREVWLRDHRSAGRPDSAPADR